ncbi:HEPN domain-containing protein [Aphanizomenon flos-aquae]|nr:HEPN domain-containing protein [Aphanizomenon flos-aquae]
MTNLVSKTIKSFIYMGCGVNKLIFGITGTEEPKFVGKKIDDITNCKTEKIKRILLEFSSDWENEFTNKINDQIKTAIDNVVQNRHKIAHGKSIPMSYHNILNYYNNVKKAVEILEEIIK